MYAVKQLQKQVHGVVLVPKEKFFSEHGSKNTNSVTKCSRLIRTSAPENHGRKKIGIADVSCVVKIQFYNNLKRMRKKVHVVVFVAKEISFSEHGLKNSHDINQCLRSIRARPTSHHGREA